jgi:pilus assembly protein Flp/PilA
MWNSILNRIAPLSVWRDSSGQDLIEYSLGAGMVALTAVATMPTLQAAVSNIFVMVGSLINSAV